MKTVLIALDYDPSAKKVSKVGYEIGKAMNAKIIFQHVISDPIYYSSNEYSPILGFSGYLDTDHCDYETRDGLKKVSQDFLDKYKNHFGDDNIQTLVSEGDFSEAILTAAKHHKADLIVLGSHSHSWLENVIIGSVTENVLHHTNIPLLIIPIKNIE